MDRVSSGECTVVLCDLGAGQAGGGAAEGHHLPDGHHVVLPRQPRAALPHRGQWETAAA